MADNSTGTIFRVSYTQAVLPDSEERRRTRKDDIGGVVGMRRNEAVRTAGGPLSLHSNTMASGFSDSNIIRLDDRGALAASQDHQSHLTSANQPPGKPRPKCSMCTQLCPFSSYVDSHISFDLIGSHTSSPRITHLVLFDVHRLKLGLVALGTPNLWLRTTHCAMTRITPISLLSCVSKAVATMGPTLIQSKKPSASIVSCVMSRDISWCSGPLMG